MTHPNPTSAARIPGLLLILLAPLAAPAAHARAEAADDPRPTFVQAHVPEGWPTDFGPFYLENDAGDRLQVSLISQLRVEILEGDAARDPQWGAPRIRPIFQGRVWDDRVRFALQLNTSPNSLELFDVWVEARFDGAALRLGQYKVPFTRYRDQSFATLPLVDWALTTRLFGSERQFGFMLHDGQRAPRFPWRVGVFTGVAARARHGIGTTWVYQVQPENPSDLRDPGDRGDIHPELVGRVGVQTPGIKANTSTDFFGGPLRYSANLSVAWDLRPVARRDFALRVAPELLLRLHGLSLAAVGYAGFFASAEEAQPAFWEMPSLEAGVLGALLEADYRVHWLVSVALRYALESRLDAINEDARRFPADPDQIDPRLPELAARHELGVGLNFYVVGHDLEVQLDFRWLRQRGADGGPLDGETFDDYRARAQLQIRL